MKKIVFYISVSAIAAFLATSSIAADHPFENDPEIIGYWKSFDFVQKVRNFDPKIKTWQGELFLKEVRSIGGGRTSAPWTWTKDWPWPSDGKTKAWYKIKQMEGEAYLFLLWLSGDVAIRGQKPWKALDIEKVSFDDMDANTREDSHVHSEANIIVPGVRVGDYRLGMSKDDVLKILGESKGDALREAKNSISVDGLILNFADDTVKSIDVLSPLYKFADGLGIGDSEQRIKQAFGNDFQFKETQWKDFLIFENEGLQFEIHKKNRTVIEFSVTQKNARGHGRSLAKEIKSVKEYDDVRWKVLSKLDLSSRSRLIATLRFNRQTVWPEQAKMPPGVDPNRILTNAMNPGLGVRKLHEQGITGKGVNVAIIDQPTYLVHPEFAGKIVAYHDTGCETDESSMHGPAVASLLVGTNCGTAPDARVYYAAAPSWKRDAAYYAKGLDWIIAQNEKLLEGEKIRVVSVSASPNQSSWANRQMWDSACARANADGIMVLDCTDDSHRGFIGKCWYNAKVPESVAQCNPWDPPNKDFRFNPNSIGILVPSAPRTTAEDGDKGKFGYRYQYCGRGGLSWSIPYCAGVLAMGWQVNPELSPEQMRELLFKSAYTKKNGAKIINPKRFIHLVRRAKAAPTTKTRRYRRVRRQR